MDNLLDLLICRIPGLRANERISLQKKFDREDDFSVFSMRDIEKLLGRALEGHRWKMPELYAMAEKDATEAQRIGIRLVSWRDEAYPPLLREIYDPPAVLFYRGYLPDPVKPLVAVVGTRKPSAFAAERARNLGRELGEAGIPVVSGLALGIDSMAHRGNIEGGSPTVAVLGSSPDMIYPVSNRFLARRILETGGAILSEYPPGTGPRKWNFPARNRIISALARGVVIVEAPEKSGALITARFALEHNRDLWVDRAGLASKLGGGIVRLAEEGAAVISSVADILEEWNMPVTTDVPTAAEADTEAKRDHGFKEEADLASSMAEYLDIKL